MSLLGKQPECWQEMSPDQLPQGAVFPLELASDYIRPAEGELGLDLGCGTGKKTMSWKLAGFDMLGVDINGVFIDLARDEAKGLWDDGPCYFQPGDATRRVGSGKEDRNSLIELPELFRFVKVEALLCNLMGGDLQRGVGVIDYYLEPDGYVFLADCLRCDSPAFARLLRSSGQGESQIAELVGRWQQRYLANQALGLPKGHFVVAKPGAEKEKEWADADGLKVLIDGPYFERWVRHFSSQELTTVFSQQGLRLVSWQPTLFYNRSQQPLLGCLAVFQKGELYKYLPGLVGKPPSAKEAFLDSLAQSVHPGDLWSFWNRYFSRLSVIFGRDDWKDFVTETLISGDY